MQLKTVLTSLAIAGALSTQVAVADLASTISGAVDTAKDAATKTVTSTVSDTVADTVASVTGTAPAIKAGDYDDFNSFVTKAGIMPPCTTCHKLGNKLVGPSYNAVALYYADKKDDAEAITALKEKVAAGGSGTWGAIPMPANGTAKAEDIESILNWILALELSDDAKATAQAEIDAMPTK
ncbi:c-type cytochrome [Candidatus Albibeggiatoa sp. nov. BB20]|uniref:c-type cytochrome n=1 Tax=Candidatus Albibeggiatoa sp. nov. BB20 TaxID=3162723 RepID=UPI00336538BA